MEYEPTTVDREFLQRQLGHWITRREDAVRAMMVANKEIEQISDYMIKLSAFQMEIPYGETQEEPR